MIRQSCFIDAILAAIAVVTLVSLHHANAADLAIRKDIKSMSSDELLEFRNAFRRVQNDGTFQILAGDHGFPGGFCPHGSLKFTAWHRRFLSRLESILGVALPYWSVSDDASIPKAFIEATYTDVTGNVWPNPLLGSVIPGVQGVTQRRPVLLPVEQFQESEAFAMSRQTFEAFSNAIEEMHNTVHGMVGGSLNSIDYAAYDPLFWVLHCNIDRIWARWQLMNNEADYSTLNNITMQDSMGAFQADPLIQDLSRWMVVSEVETMPPRPESQPIANASAFMVPTESASRRQRQQQQQQALEIMSTEFERRASAAGNHLILTVLQQISTVDPYRVDVMIENVCVGSLFLFGTGAMGSPYTRDRSLDVTFGYQKLLPGVPLEDATKVMSVSCINEVSGVVVPDFAAKIKLEWLHY